MLQEHPDFTLPVSGFFVRPFPHLAKRLSAGCDADFLLELRGSSFFWQKPKMERITRTRLLTKLNMVILLTWTVSRMRPLTRTSFCSSRFIRPTRQSPEFIAHSTAPTNRNLTRGQEFRSLSVRQCTWYPRKFFIFLNFTKANFEYHYFSLFKFFLHSQKEFFVRRKAQ